MKPKRFWRMCKQFKSSITEGRKKKKKELMLEFATLLRGECQEVLPAQCNPGVLLLDAEMFISEEEILNKRRMVHKMRKFNQTAVPLSTFKFASLRGKIQECSMLEAMELLENGEHNFSKKRGIRDRKHLISMLRYAAKYLFTVHTSNSGGATQQTWEWLQIRLATATLASLLADAEKNIINAFGES
jgi:hypothetical protein